MFACKHVILMKTVIRCRVAMFAVGVPVIASLYWEFGLVLQQTGVRFVDVRMVRALLLRIYVGAPDFRKLWYVQRSLYVQAHMDLQT